MASNPVGHSGDLIVGQMPAALPNRSAWEIRPAGSVSCPARGSCSELRFESENLVSDSVGIDLVLAGGDLGAELGHPDLVHIGELADMSLKTL